MVKLLKKVWKLIVDFFEIYLSAACFVVMFFAFVLQIFTRYILGYQVEWTYEATVIGFMWVVAFGGSYASRLREHVSFSMVYDKMSPKWQYITEIATNIFIIVFFAIMFSPVVDFVNFMAIKKTAVLKVPMSVLYAPFIYFTVSSVFYIIRDTIKSFKGLIGLKRQREKTQ